MISRCSASIVLFALLSVHRVFAEDAPTEASPADGDADAEDPTKSLMKQLTIANSGTVLDERTFSVKDAKTKATKTVRLGNVAPIQQAGLSEEQYQEKVEAGKEALAKLVGPMFLWKAAPDEHQPKGEDEDFVLGDAWTTHGYHVPSSLVKDGHLVASQEYESELAQDILQAATGKEKQDAYAKLDEALKQNKADGAAAAAAAQKAEEDAVPAEPIGLGGWIGLFVLAALVVGVFTNFGQGDNKKKNPNRKKSSMEKLWSKVKGQ